MVLLATHTARGTADEAAEVIASASTGNPDDVDLPYDAGPGVHRSRGSRKGRTGRSSLIAKDGSAYLRATDVARLYLKTDKIQEAVRIVAGMSEQMLAEREEARLLELVTELLTSDSDNVEALRLLVRAYWWQRDIDNLKAALERLAEAAQAAGLVQDERYALTQLTRLAPELMHHIERLDEIGGAEAEAAAEVLPEFEPAVQTQSESVSDESGIRGRVERKFFGGWRRNRI